MRKTTAILIAGLVMTMVTASVASAKPGVERQEVVQIFDDSGEPTGPTPIGKAKLVRRGHQLRATAQVTGLKPGGVYTFWWLVGDDFAAFPDVFVALGDSAVVGKNGKATARMKVRLGEESIRGFLDDTTAPFHQYLDYDLQTAEVHVEIAYHGQVDDPDFTDQWLLDFWTGAEGLCPIEGSTQAGMQPHCPVSYAAVFLSP